MKFLRTKVVPLAVYFNGRLVAKSVVQDGAGIIATFPTVIANASSRDTELRAILDTALLAATKSTT